jgi:hypothetical protein
MNMHSRSSNFTVAVVLVAMVTLGACGSEAERLTTAPAEQAPTSGELLTPATKPTTIDNSTTIDNPEVPETPPVSVEPAPTSSLTIEPPKPAEVVAITGIVRDVEYYPACQNSSVTIDERLWWPVPGPEWRGLPGLLAEYEAIISVERQDPVDPAAGIRTRVPGPGPGDDIGTLFIYADGYARFITDNGLGIWLTTDEQTYNWVC